MTDAEREALQEIVDCARIRVRALADDPACASTRRVMTELLDSVQALLAIAGCDRRHGADRRTTSAHPTHGRRSQRRRWDD